MKAGRKKINPSEKKTAVTVFFKKSFIVMSGGMEAIKKLIYEKIK